MVPVQWKWMGTNTVKLQNGKKKKKKKYEIAIKLESQIALQSHSC